MPGSNSSDGAPTTAAAVERLAPLIAVQPAASTGRVRSLQDARRALRIPTSAAPDVLRAWGVPNEQLIAFAVSDDGQRDLVAEFARLLVVHRDGRKLVTGRRDASLRMSEKGNALWIVYGSVIRAIDRALVLGNLSLGPAFDLQAGDAGNDAALGVTAEMLRLISPAKLLSEAVELLQRRTRWAQLAPQRPVGSTVGSPEPTGHVRRSHVSDQMLEEIAVWYLRFCRRGPHPLPQLAEKLGISRSQARDRVYRARQQGWLAPGRERRAGGQPGPRLLERGWLTPTLVAEADPDMSGKPDRAPTITHAHPPQDNHDCLEPPEVPWLTAAIGNSYAGYYTVHATAQKLIWQGPADQPGISERTQEIELDDHAWSEFWSEIDRIDAWTWDRRHYETAGVIDDTNWQLQAANEHHTLNTSGSNAYPGKKGGTDTSDEFEAFCRAVSRLAGGNTFR